MNRTRVRYGQFITPRWRNGGHGGRDSPVRFATRRDAPIRERVQQWISGGMRTINKLLITFDLSRFGQARSDLTLFRVDRNVRAENQNRILTAVCPRDWNAHIPAHTFRVMNQAVMSVLSVSAKFRSVNFMTKNYETIVIERNENSYRTVHGPFNGGIRTTAVSIASTRIHKSCVTCLSCSCWRSWKVIRKSNVV